jgi:hypothetical protein
MITASDWREVMRNSLKGFCHLTLSPSGLILRDCALHERDGRRWIGLPSRPQIDWEGRHRKDPVTGKLMWSPTVEIRGREERERFHSGHLHDVRQPATTSLSSTTYCAARAGVLSTQTLEPRAPNPSRRPAGCHPQQPGCVSGRISDHRSRVPRRRQAKSAAMSAAIGGDVNCLTELPANLMLSRFRNDRAGGIP